jgi:tripartite-type tricarboxylate transporter receptor subunit TctC
MYFESRTIASALLGLGAALIAGLSSSLAHAQGFPSQPIQLVVPWPAGGGADRIMRITADSVSKKMGVPVVVLNKPGAGGTLGIREALSGKPDGYTVVMVGDGAVLAQYNNPNANSFDDMEPVIFFGEDPFAITVNPKTGFKNLADFVSYAKANPGKLRNGNDQPGGSSAIAAATFEKQLGIRVTKIPYPGFAPSVQALLSGEVDSVSVPLIDVIEHHEAGKVRILGISASQRHFKGPDVPTFAEQGFKVNASLWRIIMTAKGTPPDRVKALEAGFLAGTTDNEFQQRAKAAGFLVTPASAAEARKRWEEHDRANYPLFLEAGLVKTRHKK